MSSSSSSRPNKNDTPDYDEDANEALQAEPNPMPTITRNNNNNDNDNNNNNNNNSNNGTLAPSLAPDPSLAQIQSDLLNVERGLAVQRRQRFLGRAAFNSVSSALGSIRERLSLSRQASTGSISSSNKNSSRRQSSALLCQELSERLNLVELAHSARIPLELLQPGRASSPQTQRRSSLLSRSMAHHYDNKHEDDDEKAVASDEDQPHEETAACTVEQESPERNRSSSSSNGSLRRSSWVASRARVDQAYFGGTSSAALPLQTDLDRHEHGATATASVQVASMPSVIREEVGEKLQGDDNSTGSSSSCDKLDLAIVEPETHILLTKAGRQSLLQRSDSSLSGSLRLPSAQSGSVVYSWGSGVQSLHDDANDKTVDQASVSSDSRIGRPGAPAVLSVATNHAHTACATAQGQVLVCGDNREGAVDPDRRDEEIISRPALLESLEQQTRVVQVSCGLHHTAALSSNGSVLTWGRNVEGQLGHRHNLNNSDTATRFCRPQGFLLGGGRRAAAVTCGHYFTLALTTRMSVMAAGIPEIAGFTEDDVSRLPAFLPALEGLPLVAVAAGNRHALVLTANGTCYAWGANQYGCCGRPYPENLSVPVPIHVPESRNAIPATGPAPFPNWAVWGGDCVSLADDVAIVHACCGDEHTVLVTRSGRLLVCGNNSQGQLGLTTESPATSVQAVIHPESNRGKRFSTAEAGDEHTLLLDDNGDVYQMGNGTISGPQPVLTGKSFLAIAAGGKESIAIAAGTGALRLQFSVSIENISVGGSKLAESLEDLLDIISSETDESQALSSSSQELANRTEELLRYPAVLNSLFLNPKDLDHMYEKLMSVDSPKSQQAIATAIENGIRSGLASLDSGNMRMIYPEAVRCLLHYIKFFDRTEGSTIVFDLRGTCIMALCETILGLPFEGYQALLRWATTIYPGNLYARMLVRPLLAQLNRSHGFKIDADGVEHAPLSIGSIPVIIAVLRWLNDASTRAGEIALPEDFYCKAADTIPIEALFDDLTRYKKATQTQRSSHFFLSANSFLLSPGTKRNLLQVENQVEMFKVATKDVTFDAATQQYSFDPFWVLEIDREHLVEQTLETIKVTKASELRKKLRVVFKGEEGIDAGGVTKEFFQLLSEDLFDVSSSLWSSRYGDLITWFNSDCTWDDEGYTLVGVLVGLALYNGVLIDVHFPPAVYRKILGLSLGLEDMVDDEVRKGLQQLLDYEGDDIEDVFCLNFEVGGTDLGQEQKVELKPGGTDISVTSDNRDEYVVLYVKWLLADSIQPQWDAFEKGLMQIVESSSLDMLRPEELELLVVGTPELDFSALEHNTAYEGGFDKDSEVVCSFWRFVKDASRETQIKLLKFATGSKMAPIGGLGELPLTIQRAGPDSPQLPTSHTCFNTLLLPDYGSDYDKLSTRLGRAILECEGFGLE